MAFIKLSCCSDGAAGGTILFCRDEDQNQTRSTWNGGDRMPLGRSSVQQRWRIRRAVFFAVTKISIECGISSLPLSLQAEPFFFAATEIRIGRGIRCRYGRSRRAIPHCCDDGAAVIRKSGPEIKNHCTLEDVSWQIPAVILKSAGDGVDNLKSVYFMCLFYLKSVYLSA